MFNTKSKTYDSLGENIKTFELKNPPFVLSILKINPKTTQIKYTIKSQQRCLGMQFFFSIAQITNEIKTSDAYTQLDLTNIQNFLLLSFNKYAVSTKKELTENLTSFKEKYGINNPLYLNIFCPFWTNEAKMEDFIITYELSHDQPENNNTEKNLYQQSLDSYNQSLSIGSSILVSNFKNSFSNDSVKGNSMTYRRSNFDNENVLKVS